MTLPVEQKAAIFILAAAILLFSIYSICSPVFEASDELWHYPLVQHLATTATLPIQHAGQSDAEAPWRQEGSQPPLYYAIAALAIAPIDSSNWRQIRRINPHSDLGTPTRDGNINAVLHTSAEQFPWTRATLTVHVARFVSVIFSGLTVLFTYLSACELFPRSRDLARPVESTTEVDQMAWLRLGTMCITATIPMFAFISGSVNNDSAVTMFSTAGLWWALRFMRRIDLSVVSAIIAALIISAAILCKSSALGLVIVFALASLLASLKSLAPPTSSKYPHTAVVYIRFMVIVVVVVILLTGWWFIRNQFLYGDPLGWNAFLDISGRRIPPASLAQLWTEREGFIWAFWGVFGTLNLIMPPVTYSILNGVVGIALVSMVLYAVRSAIVRQRNSNDHDQKTTLAESAINFLYRHRVILICISWLLITFIALLRWTSLTVASQGRLMFPCLAIIAAAIAYGLYRLHRYVLVAVVMGLAGLCFSIPFTLIAPAYAQPAMLANPAPVHPLNVTFGNSIILLGYDALDTEVQPGGEVRLRLYWRATEPQASNYSVFVHLINEDDVIVAQRDMYPGQGSIATSELPPGFTWSDQYALHLSPLIPAPQNLHWGIGLYDFQTGQRLMVTQGNTSDQGVVFGPLNLSPRETVSTGLLDYGNGIHLVAYKLSSLVPMAGQPLSITLNWTATANNRVDSVISLQLLDEKANKIAQVDQLPATPMSMWQPGTPITDTHILQIARDAPSGVYRLLLVLYTPRSLTRSGAYWEDGIYIGTEVELTRLRVR